MFLALFLAAFVLTVEGAAGLLDLEVVFEVDPLAAVLGLLGTGHILPGLAASLAVVVVAIVLGRAFCGWVCPMGTLLTVVGLARPAGAPRDLRNRSGPHQRIKYAILAFGLAAAIMGSAVAGWLDPLSFLARGLSEGLLPCLARVLDSAARLMALIPVYPLSRAPDGVQVILGPLHLAPADLVSTGALLTLVLLVAALASSAWMGRFFCRALCPLGAMLGLLSRWSLFGLDRDEQACTACGACAERCEGAADPDGRWKPHECVLCLNCQASCPEGALAFRFFPSSPHSPVDPGRRALLISAAAGIAAVPAARSGVRGAERPYPRRIRPPGALPEEEFLAMCIRCGSCMKACPTNAIQPALLEAGVEGIYTPVVVPPAGSCEPPCVLCTEVCATGAIAPLTPGLKGWETRHPSIRIGTAVIDRGSCLPWANGIPCIVCEEHCPVADKAILLEDVEATDAEGSAVTLQRPRVDPARCVGCGACEHVCPVASRPAVTVIAWNESRHTGPTPGKLSM